MPTAAECDPPKSRYSIAFFMQADKAAKIDNSAGTITAGDYLLGRIKSNYEAVLKAKQKAESAADATDKESPAKKAKKE